MIYDITPPVSEAIAVWPGDTKPSREVLCAIERGDTVTLSTLHATVHLGAHADAPNHYAVGAPGIDERPLETYVGRCQVISVEAKSHTRIRPNAIVRSIEAARVLLATRSFPDPTRFNEDFAALSAELIDDLAQRGVRLVGIDTPSVDLFDSKDLPSHQAALRHDMAILEGLVLDEVPDGVFELIALPLKLVGFDASPVRAVLRTLDES